MNIMIMGGIVKRIMKFEGRNGLIANGSIQVMETFFSSKTQRREVRYDYVNFKAFGETAKILIEHGDGVFIEAQGKCLSGSYDNKEGKKVYTQDFQIERVTYPTESEQRMRDKQAGAHENTSYGDGVPSSAPHQDEGAPQEAQGYDPNDMPF